MIRASCSCSLSVPAGSNPSLRGRSFPLSLPGSAAPYRVLIRVRSRGKGNPLPLIALLCYVFYLISQYLVLFLSRAREYYADRFSGRVTRNPNALAGALVKIAYPGGPFAEASVASLLKRVKVSAVRAVPVALKGRIIGRGIPGLIYSEGLVLQDETGLIFLDYRQPLRIIEFLFGLFRTPGIIGEEVVVEGWYRRAPVPYVEMKSLSYDRSFHRCYVYPVKLALSILVFALGIGLMLAGV